MTMPENSPGEQVGCLSAQGVFTHQENLVYQENSPEELGIPGEQLLAGNVLQENLVFEELSGLEPYWLFCCRWIHYSKVTRMMALWTSY